MTETAKVIVLARQWPMGETLIPRSIRLPYSRGDAIAMHITLRFFLALIVEKWVNLAATPISMTRWLRRAIW